MHKHFFIAFILLLPVISCKSSNSFTDDTVWNDSKLIAQQQQAITRQTELIGQLGQQLGSLRQSVEQAGENVTDLRAWAREHRELERRIVAELYRLEELCNTAGNGYAETGYGTDGELPGFRKGAEKEP